MKKSYLSAIVAIIMIVTTLPAFATENSALQSFMDLVTVESITQNELEYLVTKDLVLPTAPDGIKVTYSSSDEDAITNGGIVTRSVEEEKAVTFTVSATDGTETLTKKFSLTVAPEITNVLYQNNFYYPDLVGTSTSVLPSIGWSDGWTSTSERSIKADDEGNHYLFINFAKNGPRVQNPVKITKDKFTLQFDIDYDATDGTTKIIDLFFDMNKSSSYESSKILRFSDRSIISGATSFTHKLGDGKTTITLEVDTENKLFRLKTDLNPKWSNYVSMPGTETSSWTGVVRNITFQQGASSAAAGTVSIDNMSVIEYKTPPGEMETFLDSITSESITQNELEYLVTKDLVLPTAPDGIKITYSSSDEEVITNDGKVIQDAEEDLPVTFTVSVTDGTETLEKELELTVVSEATNVLYQNNFYYPGLVGTSTSVLPSIGWSDGWTSTSERSIKADDEGNHYLFINFAKSGPRVQNPVKITKDKFILQFDIDYDATGGTTKIIDLFFDMNKSSGYESSRILRFSDRSITTGATSFTHKLGDGKTTITLEVDTKNKFFRLKTDLDPTWSSYALMSGTETSSWTGTIRNITFQQGASSAAAGTVSIDNMSVIEGIAPETDIFFTTKLESVSYNKTSEELGMWIRNVAGGAGITTDVIVAGFSNGKLTSAHLKESVTIKASGRTYVDIGDFDFENVTDVKVFLFDPGTLVPKSLSSTIKKDDIEEVYGEENLTYGQATAVRRADQLTEFTFSPVKKMISATGKGSYTFFEQGVTYQGIPYSSCEINDKFICENVSFETFLSALANPDSVLYTKDITHASNASTYYGMVCNGFVRYCLGIVQRCNTKNWLDIPGMTVIAEAGTYSENDIKVADVLHAYGSGSNHVAMITDIIRDKDGNIIAIEVSEEVHQTSKRRVFAVQDYFASYAKYRLCRYDYLEEIPPFDEEQNAILYSGLDKIQPMIAVDHGDKSNYLEGETIVISSFMDGENTVVIEKDGEVIEEVSVNGYKKLERALSGGYYKIWIKDTDYVTEFCVCKPIISHIVADGKITVTAAPADSESEICHMDFRTGTGAVGGLATGGMIALTDEEKETGIITRTIPSDAGSFKIYFENKYGIWTHTMIPIQ